MAQSRIACAGYLCSAMRMSRNKVAHVDRHVCLHAIILPWKLLLHLHTCNVNAGFGQGHSNYLNLKAADINVHLPVQLSSSICMQRRVEQ